MLKKKFLLPPKSPAQAMVEFALVLPILLLIIYGILEVGRLLFIYSSVVSAARQAARYGAAAGLNTNGGVPRYRDCAGMRTAAQRVGFIDKIEDADILIWHDEGEEKNQVAYCAPGSVSDSSFQPSIGNTSRVRVQVSTQYTPIVPLVPLQPLTISSVSARTILVSVQLAVTGAAQNYDYEIVTSAPSRTAAPTTTAVPTRTAAGHPPSAATAAAPCDVRHSVLKSSPFGMIIYNYNAALTIHIAEIQIWAPPSPAGQSLNRLTLGGAAIWSGALQSDLPTIFSTFIGDVSIKPRSNKFLRVSLSKNYNADGSEKILVAFAENACPVLDSSDVRQLP
jgi:Flp pilus assembly protein TadG